MRTWKIQQSFSELHDNCAIGPVMQDGESVEVAEIQPIKEAVAALKIDQSWLTHGAGTFVTIEVKKLLAILKAVGLP